jgi:hypothetical protein
MNLMMKSGFMAYLLVGVAFQTIGRVFFRQLKIAICMPREYLPLAPWIVVLNNMYLLLK